MRRSLLALVVLCSVAAAQPAPSDLPVILVHGLNAADTDWHEAIVHFEGLGYGEAVSYHADLNASNSTAWADDVVLAYPVSYWDFAGAEARCAGPDTTRALLADAPLARALPLDHAAEAARRRTGGRLFVVNFDAAYDADADVVYVHTNRGVIGHSESNQSAVVKQGAALGAVVRDVLQTTGADRVVLVGHSMGGLAIREYLQRRTVDGPVWWADPTREGGHGVAAVVTYGTPHQGCNLSSGGLIELFNGISIYSEAVRDLRYSYLTNGPGRYLWGGSETSSTGYYHNFDVNADGDEDDAVAGINVGDPDAGRALDNPAMPLPRDVWYTYLVGNSTGSGDGIVALSRQLLWDYDADGTAVVAPAGRSRAVETTWGHRSQNSDYTTIAAAVATAFPTGAEDDFAPASPALTVSPNPVRGQARVALSLSAPARVRVSVHDVLGRHVVDLRDEPLAVGEHVIDWAIAGLAPGVYVMTASAGGSVLASRTVTVVR